MLKLSTHALPAFIAILAGFACTPKPALADDACASLSNIVTRPTVTNSVCTVPQNHTLIETGYQNITASGGGNAVTYPQTLIRVGTAVKHLEVEFAPPSVIRAGAQHGYGDIGGGVKYVFLDRARYQLGAQINATAPTGDAFASAGASQTTFAVNGAVEISPVFTIESTQSFASNAAGGVRYGSYTPSLVLAASLPHASSIYGEYALTTHATGPGTASRTQFIFGVSHDVGQRLQVDLEGISSPTAATGKYSGIGFGVSYLI